MQSRACWSLAASTLAYLALAAPRAQAADAVAADAVTAAPAATANASAPKSPGSDDAAAVAFSRALQLHAAGDLEGARSSMLESYRLSNRAELLYNIGKLQSVLGECALALAAYRGYLEQVPDGRYRVEALQASAELEAKCPSAASAVAAPASSASTLLAAPPLNPVATPTHQGPRQSEDASAATASAKQDAVVPASNRAATVRWIGWSAIAAGAVAGGSSVYFTVMAYDAHDRFEDNVRQAARGEVAFDRSIQDEQHSHQRWARILGVTGGVLLVGGSLALLFGTGRSEPVRTSVDVQVLPGAVAGSYQLSF